MNETEVNNNAFNESDNDESSGHEPNLSNIERSIKENFPKIYKIIPDEDKNSFFGFIGNSSSISFTEQKLHSGPIPSPESLDKYNSIIPNGADRIMKMAENQSQHRMKIEEREINSQYRQNVLGQIFGFIISILGIVGGIISGIYGSPWVGGIIGGGTVVSLATVFVLGKKYQNNNNNNN